MRAFLKGRKPTAGLVKAYLSAKKQKVEELWVARRSQQRIGNAWTPVGIRVPYMDAIRSILEGLQVTVTGEDGGKGKQMWSELRRQLLRMRPRIMSPAKSWTLEEKQKLQEL